MGIVHMEGNLLIQFVNILMHAHVFCSCRLQCCRDKEILLFQAQLFTGHMVVIRIQNAADCARKILLLDCLVIITFIKGCKFEVIDCLCIPDTQCIYDVVVIAEDRQIIRNCKNGLIAFLLEEAAACLFIIG